VSDVVALGADGEPHARQASSPHRPIRDTLRAIVRGYAASGRCVEARPALQSGGIRTETDVAIAADRVSNRESSKAMLRLGIISLSLLVTAWCWATPVQAYLDPGAGNVLLQGIIGAVAASAGFAAYHWRRLRALLSGRKPDQTDSRPMER
jgi:hypothetical protein